MDAARTGAYYAALGEEELCQCEACRRFRRQIRHAYPAVAAWLEGLGVDPAKPMELWPLDPGPDGRFQCLDVQYPVLGSAEDFRPATVEGVEIGLADAHPPTDLAEAHFVIQASPFSLKWS